jgi:hypothetical protein
MNSFVYKVALAIGAGLLAASCADTGAAVSEKDDMLAVSGFVPKKADNAARMRR